MFIEEWNSNLIDSLAQEKERFPHHAALIFPCDYVPPGKAVVCTSEVKADCSYFFVLILLNPRDIKR